MFKYLFIFALFSIFGWILELSYKSTMNKKIINPGLLMGCSITIYGFGAVILNIICTIIYNVKFSHKIIIIFILSILLLTLLELITGKILLKIFNVRFWDYSNLKLNYKGIICLEFSLIWGVLAVIFYLFIFPWINNFSINIVNQNFVLFLLGIYYGIFIIDLLISINLLNKITKYSKKVNKIINIEILKTNIEKESSKKILSIIFPYLSINKFITHSMTTP